MNDATARLPAPPSLRTGWRPAWDGDVAWSFRHSPVAIASLAVFLLCVIAALFAP